MCLTLYLADKCQFVCSYSISMMFLLRCSILLAILLPSLARPSRLQGKTEKENLPLKFGTVANYQGETQNPNQFTFAGFQDLNGTTTKQYHNGNKRKRDNSGSIVDTASIEKFPWQVSVQMIYEEYEERYHRCGGFILSAKWIGTAAQCVSGYEDSPQYIRIFSGSNDLKQDGYLSRVYQIVVHQGFDWYTHLNDIAWIQLETPLDLNNENRRALDLPQEGLRLQRETVVVSGWGYIYDWDPSTQMLQSVEIKAVPLRKCKKAFENTHSMGVDEYLDETKICAGLPNKNACFGDEGDPLVMKTGDSAVVVGIASDIHLCVDNDIPGAYTKMSYYAFLTSCVISD